MKTIAERIAEGMHIRKMKQVDIIEKAGINKGALSSYIAGKYEPKQTNIYKIAKALEVSEAWLMGYDVPMDRAYTPDKELKIKNIEDILQIKTQKIPLIGDIACGVPHLAEENFESYVELGTDVRADFALRCHGDSMINARILDGDIVFIKKQDYINNGEIAAVLIENEATLKRVYITDTTITLLAENTAYPPTIIDRRDDSGMVFKILGKAVAFQSDVK